MADDCPVTENVIDANAPFRQSASDEKTTVTIERIMLGAHQRNAMFPCPLDYAIEPPVERGRLRHLFVVGRTVAVETTFLGAAAELASEKDVGNPGRAQFLTQLVAIELGKMPRVRRGANVGDCRHAGTSQERNEAVPRMRGMSDRQNIYRFDCLHHVTST